MTDPSLLADTQVQADEARALAAKAVAVPASQGLNKLMLVCRPVSDPTSLSDGLCAGGVRHVVAVDPSFAFFGEILINI